ncbi:MAG: hypothetical protein M1814_000015 [Vezdaea aestivalis]|nr:MAG: hypothetical protein M1814_000015 [Vezdaea aestivalis]
MSSGLVSDEVAEDYKNSLEDLNMNSRYEISNLTIIAKENLDHATAITRVLEYHINSTAPPRKLPALYVLDSVAKNVGSPYPLLFSRNLYHTFMDAYSLVDAPIRRKLEEMLKTWKEPVAGSIDTKPVFPTDVTRRIDNALIKARTAAVQLQQQQARSQQQLLQRRPGTNTPPVPIQGWRQTPPPMRAIPYPGPPEHSPYPSPAGSSIMDGRYRSYQTPPVGQFPQPGIENLNRDIDRLIDRAQAEMAINPYSPEPQQRVKALIELREIVQTQQLPFDQLERIKEQVALISQGDQGQHPLPPARHDQLHTVYNLPPQNVAPPPPQPPLQFPPGALAALLSAGPRPTSAPPQTITPSLIPPPTPTQTPAIAPTSLLDSLRAAGMLPPTPGATVSQPGLPSNLPFPLPLGGLPADPSVLAHGVLGMLPTRLAMADSRNLIELKSTSLKKSHPELISQLYEARPNQCTTCGVRFLATDEDKKKKAKHLDWHFRTNQRMAESAKRGQSRSWYLDESDWIKNREGDQQQEGDENTAGGQTNGGLSGLAAKKDPKKQWIPVPDDPTMANLHCPICQEKFETVWLDEAQEWVWMDAVRVGGRIFHASCHEEAAKDREATPARNGTPESLLGKRKAVDADLTDSDIKVKKELKV